MALNQECNLASKTGAGARQKHVTLYSRLRAGFDVVLAGALPPFSGALAACAFAQRFFMLLVVLGGLGCFWQALRFSQALQSQPRMLREERPIAAATTRANIFHF